MTMLRRWLKALFPLLVFACGGPPLEAQAAIALAQPCVVTTNAATAATSVTATISTTAGSLLVAGCRQGSNNTATLSMTDSASQTWTQSPGGYVNVGTGAHASLFYIANSSAVTSVTCNFSASVGPTDEVEVCEYTGVATSTPTDGEALSNTGFAASLASGALTTTNANDLLVYWVSTGASASAWTCGSGFTLVASATTRMALCYQIVAATQSSLTTTTSWTTSNAAGGDFIAFEASGGAAPAVTPGRTLTGAGT